MHLFKQGWDYRKYRYLNTSEFADHPLLALNTIMNPVKPYEILLKI